MESPSDFQKCVIFEQSNTISYLKMDLDKYDI